MPLESEYPALAEAIRRLRDSGVPEADIAQVIQDRIRASLAAGFSRSDVQRFVTRGVRHPLPDLPEATFPGAPWPKDFSRRLLEHKREASGEPVSRETYGQAFASGMARGALLGAVGSPSEDHPWVQMAGEVVGGIPTGIGISALVGAGLGAILGPPGVAAGAAAGAALPRATGLRALLPTGRTLAQEAITGGIFTGAWDPFGEAGLGERLRSAAGGAVAGPPIGMILRGLWAGGRRILGRGGEAAIEESAGRAQAALPPTAAAPDPWRTSVGRPGGVGRPMPGEGQRMFPPPRLSLPPGPSRVAGRPSTEPGPSGEPIPMGGDILAPSPTLDAARAFRAESAEIQQITETIARLERAGQPVPGFLRRSLESSRRRMPGAPPPGTRAPSPSPVTPVAGDTAEQVAEKARTSNLLVLADQLYQQGGYGTVGDAFNAVSKMKGPELAALGKQLGTPKPPRAGTPPSPEPALDWLKIQVTAKDKNLEVHPRQSGGYDVTGPGGRGTITQDKPLANLAEVHGFLESYRVETSGKMPVEMSDTPAGESTFEKAAMGKRLSKADRKRLKFQAQMDAYNANRSPFDPEAGPGRIGFISKPPDPARANVILGQVSPNPPMVLLPEGVIVVNANRLRSRLRRLLVGPEGQAAQAVMDKYRLVGETKVTPKDFEEFRDAAAQILGPERMPELQPPPVAGGAPGGRPRKGTPDLDTMVRQALLSTLKWGDIDLEGPLSEFLWNAHRPALERLGVPREATGRQIRAMLGSPVPEVPPPISGGAPAGGGSPGGQGTITTEQMVAGQGRELTPEGYIRDPRTLVDPSGRARMTLPTTQMQVETSPLLREMGFEGSRVQMAKEAELQGLGVRYRSEILDQVGRGTPDAKLAYDVQRGWAQTTNPKVLRAVRFYREFVNNMAAREEHHGLKEAPAWRFYATQVTDFNTIYQALRREWLPSRSLKGMDPQWSLKVPDEGEFSRVHRLLERFPSWDQLSRENQTFFRRLWNFHDVGIRSWEGLPSYKEHLPRQTFSPYLLERAGQVPFKEDLAEAFLAYAPSMVHHVQATPFVDRWVPILERLIGPETHFNEKGKGLSYLAKNFLNRPAAFDQTVEWMFGRLNEAVGKEMATLADARAAVSLARGGFYRGALGVQTGVLHLTRLINAWAETGRFTGPMGKLITARAETKEALGLFGNFNRILTEEFEGPGKAPSRIMQAALRADEWLNRHALAPVQWAENVARGFTFHAASEEALSRGLSPEAVLVNALSKASGIVPPLMLPESTLYAGLRRVPQFTFASRQTERAPMWTGLLGRSTNLLMTFATNEPVVLYRGLKESFQGWRGKLPPDHIRRLAAENFQHEEGLRFLRYLAATGVFTMLPSVTLGLFGYGLKETFGIGSVMDILYNPFWTMISNGVRAVSGHSIQTRAEARQEMGRAFKTVFIPQYAFGKRVQSIYRNVEQGYATDERGRYLYESTPAGELMRIIGLRPPGMIHSQEVARSLTEQAFTYRRDKQAAMDALLQGDPRLMAEFNRTWGPKGAPPIGPKDLQRAIQERQQPPEQRFGRGLPRGVRESALAEIGR